MSGQKDPGSQDSELVTRKSELLRFILIGQRDLVETYGCTLKASRSSSVCPGRWSRSSDTHQSPVQTCLQVAPSPLTPLKKRHKYIKTALIS